MKEINKTQRDVDLIDVLDIIRRGKLIIAGSIILTLAATFFITKEVITPVYEAKAKILIREEQLNPKDDFPTYDTGWQLANTQAEIIKSKNVIKNALGKIDFSARDLRGIDSNSLKISELQKNIDLSLLESTNVLELKLKQNNPVFAAALANAIAQSYIQDRTGLKNKTVEQITAGLEKQIETAKKDFIDVENELSEMANKDDMIMLSGSDMVLDLQKYADSDIQLVSVNSDIEMVDTKINAIKQSIKAEHNPTELNLKFIADNGVINDLKSQINLARLKLEVLTSQFNENHPDVVAAKAAIEVLKIDLLRESDKIVKAEIESLETEKKALIGKKEVLSAAQAKQTDRLNNIIKNQPKLANLNRDAEMKRAVYSDLTQRLQGLRILQQRTNLLPDAEIIESADVPETPVSPSLIKNLLLGSVVGIIIGFALALMFSVSEKSEDDAQENNRQGRERRVSERTKTKNKITCSVVGEKKEYTCWSSDVSASGMKIIGSEKLKQNDVIKFEIQRDKMNPIAGNGTVVWTSPIAINGSNNGFASGIKFYDIQLDINKKKT